jgi:hypothetical protein
MRSRFGCAQSPMRWTNRAVAFAAPLAWVSRGRSARTAATWPQCTQRSEAPHTARRHRSQLTAWFGSDLTHAQVARPTQTSRSSEPSRSLRPWRGSCAAEALSPPPVGSVPRHGRPKLPPGLGLRAHQVHDKQSSCATRVDLGALGTAAFAAPPACAAKVSSRECARTAHKDSQDYALAPPMQPTRP